jgi:saccharopine dehydrogenase-like NADP-dependent oxidoreductase
MKVLLLGGVGEMCTSAKKDIARSLDDRDPDQIKELMKGHDVAVNGLPKQFALDVLEAAGKIWKLYKRRSHDI